MQATNVKWNWADFKGSAVCLKLAKRDLETTCIPVVNALPQRRVAVQAGGNLGVFAKYLASRFDTVYTFEPAPELFPLLCHNAPEINIIRMQAALSEEQALISTKCERLYKHDKPPHEGVTHISGEGPTPAFALDSLKLPVCDLLYLDIEGYELRAVRGARETLRRCRPVVVTEINDCIKAIGDDPEFLHAFMRAMGYRHAYTSISDYVWIPQERTK
jgi:FkbM family methyltransferase